MASDKGYSGLEIAIIGISAQFPESRNYREFWQNLKEGKEMIKTFTDEELKKLGVPESALQNKQFVKSAAILSDKDCFDHGFFGYSVEEASFMDPQIRLFHQHCWMALEDAGYSSVIDTKKIGLFAGASINDNWKIYVSAKSANISIDPFFLKKIMSQHLISTLVSYKLNLRGPSIYVDTACSTSLSAVHLACRSLMTREAPLALAGGICIRTEKVKGYFYKEGMIASKDGHCRTFDAEASGCASGEGVGVVVLKRLSEAIKDRDHIYAVIKATSVNNDGNHKVGYTAPSVRGQAECISSAQKLADVSPRSISYIEAHGTGTKLGDPVEIRGLNEAFKVGGSDKFCAIGSVKTNMGHLDVAAGVAGLIKTALALKYKQIPASLHFKAPNPEVDFKGGPFYVNTRLKEWVRNGNSPLRAGVSSFGIGGTNVHAILEEAPEQEASGPSGSYKLLSLSAKTSASLFRYIDALKDFLLSEQTVNVSDLAYTLQVGRKHFVYRRPIVYKDKEELIGLLDAAQSGGQAIKSREQRHAVVFMFPGQGSQYVNMGKGLYLTEPLFRQYVDSGFSILEKLTGEDYKAVLFSETTGRTVIDETRYTQPLIFLLEYSLARLMMSIGIIPDYMIGHSIGEYVAACISGIFSFEEGLRLVVKRGELMNSLPPGSMLSVPITAEEAGPYLGSGISLAAINGPGQVVLSGEITAVEELMSTLNESGIPYIKLHTSHAFHSGMQDPIMESFRNEVQKIALREPTISFVSNLTGGIVGKEEALSSDYWVNHLRKTVRFSDGLKTILTSAQDLVFIEVGAGRSLTALLQQQGKPAPLSVNLIRSFKETEEDAKYFITRLGELWANGVAVDWGAYYKEEQRRRISLPTYCFEPARYPAEVNPFETGLLERLQVKTDWELKDWIYYPSWKRTVLYTAGARAFGRGYLFFSSDEKFSDSLKKELLKNGNEVVEVLMGETYKKLSVNRYIIDPVQPDHIRRLVRESGNDQVVLTDIIYSWGIGVDSSRLIWEKDNRELSLVYFSLVAIVQALAQENFLKGKKIAVLTDALHKVIGVENGSYAQSLLLGLVNVVVQECPVSCINIDVNLNEYMQGGAEKLVEEINNNDGRQGRITALRNGQRWVQDFQLNPGPAQQERTFVKPGGVYWITGGLGNVGFVLAKHLVKEYGVKLLLTGRKSINERKNGVEENKEEWLRRLDYLMSIGENVKYIKADMSKPEELNRAVAEAENEWGPILGVIHTAGLLDKKNFELIEDMTVDGAMAVLEPKVRGIENIYQLFKDRHPDFVWITSSLATVLGGLGFGAYSSANLFMDHFLMSRSDELKNWKCIGLGGLAFTEEEIESGGNTLRPNELLELFEWSLSVKEGPVILQSKGDLTSRIHKVYQPKKEEELLEDPGSEPGPMLERPDLSTGYVEPKTETELKLKAVFEGFFGMEGIGVEDAFFELGGDSLKGMMLLKRISNEFNIAIALTDFFKRQTIREIAAFIDEVSILAKDNKRASKMII